MNSEERSQALFGAWDGVVSIIGMVFGLLIHHSPMSAIAVGGFGGAISATISMSTGTFESTEGAIPRRLRDAVAMGVSTLVGSMIPIIPFFLVGRSTAILLAGIGCWLVATWIGYERHRGITGYVSAYLTILGAIGLTLVIVALIPASA